MTHVGPHFCGIQSSQTNAPGHMGASSSSRGSSRIFNPSCPPPHLSYPSPLELASFKFGLTIFIARWWHTGSSWIWCVCVSSLSFVFSWCIAYAISFSSYSSHVLNVGSDLWCPSFLQDKIGKFYKTVQGQSIHLEIFWGSAFVGKQATKNSRLYFHLFYTPYHDFSIYQSMVKVIVLSIKTWKFGIQRIFF